ncbi:hypothetical protein FNV43_RR05234 [Rhamnella rubrinervis]|uniref:Late embryogenesis abundant protein LEA-2 subgroup domain-containing protein n=1 Tax=Rhamnella rubrinervis TaxID=2594499 RepID=A0A8K0HKZ1_9ROSA|nr:hypothetical protein FNV43_RR05234 [Rhamnella rubrinervis]
MADSGTSSNNNKVEHSNLPLPAPPGRYQPTDPRHVAFKELPPKHLSDYESNNDDYDAPRKSKKRPRCFACGVRTFLCVFVFFLLLMVMAVVFISFLYASLPNVYVRMIDLSKLDVDGNHTARGKAKFNANVDLKMEFKNRNHGTKLKYGTWSVKVSWQEIKLGKTEVDGFSQKNKNITELSVRMKVQDQVVYRDGADQLMEDLKDEKAVFDVVLRGHVSIHFGAIKINGLSVSVKCDPNKGELDVARKHRCRVRLFPI